MAKHPKKDEKDPQQEREDAVLRRMLNTPPKPHDTTGKAKAKPEQKKPAK